ncbi:uncharacterized protein LOC135692942 [Rhopilema esculentum]|uniref:uncharacterized protein LOC135692942 n=1 Tax=Rhopilema esculentum TaxID=499914 RepID=UPI0031D6492B|eukprot:gene2025-17586_t
MATTGIGTLGPMTLPTATTPIIAPTIQTTTNTVANGNKNKEDNDYWVTYTFIVGIAAAVLVICTVIAIVASRYKSLRKARAQYAKDQMRARQEIEKQRRETRSRTLSTTVSIADPFYIFPFSNEPVDDSSPFDDVFYLPSTGAEKRNSFVQAIPSFSQPVPVHPARRLDLTPPPRLSPSFQGSDERLQVNHIPERRHSLSVFAQSSLTLPASQPPKVLPREPIVPPRRSRRHSHQLPSRKPPLSRQRSHSALELNIKANYGFIAEETEPPETVPRMSLPSPDYE